MGSLYSDHPTWLHRVPAGVKLLLLALLGTALFYISNPPVLAGCAAACVLLFVSLGRAMYSARRLMVSVVIAGVLIVGFHAYLGQPVLGVVSALRLVSASILGISLTLTTRHGDVLDVLELLLVPLQRLGVKTERLALQLAMMLRFTEHFFVVWKRLDDAHRMRTGKSGGARLLAPLTLHMLTSAKRVADTLELRLGE